MTDELFAMLAELPENRTAFITALIMERTQARFVAPPVAGLSTSVPLFNAYQATRIAQNLVAIATRIHTFAERDCNQGLTSVEEKRYANTQARFAKIAELCGFVAATGGDPRGACAYIADPANPSDGDDMGGRGWGVYR